MIYLLYVTSAIIIIAVEAKLNVTSSFDPLLTFDPGSNITLRCQFASDSDVIISWRRDSDIIINNNRTDGDEQVVGGGLRGDITPLSIYKYAPNDLGRTKELQDNTESNDDNKRHKRISFTEFWEKEEKVGEVRVVKSSWEDGGVITCSGRNLAGEIVEHSGRVVVKGPLSIRQQPPQEVTTGSDVIITCSVLGSTSWRMITWFQGMQRTRLNFNKRIKVKNNGTTLHINNIRLSDQGKYLCQVKDNKGEIASMTTKVLVFELPDIGPIALNQDAYKVNDLVIMTCSVKNDDEPIKFNWLKDYQPIKAEYGVQIYPLGRRVSSLVIDQVSLKMAGNYSCVTSNRFGSSSAHTDLIVRETPNIVSLKLPDAVALYSDVTISCVVRGFPLPKVTWYKYNVDGSRKLYLHSSNVSRNSTTLNTISHLTLPNATYADDGLYECFASNAAGIDHNMISLKVKAPARIYNISQVVEVGCGQPATLQCIARGDGTMNITWRKNGVLISSNITPRIWTKIRNTEIKTRLHNERKTNRSIGYLHFLVTSQSDAGTYSCSVTNQFGNDNVTSQLIVHSKPDPPRDVTIAERGSSFLRLFIYKPNNTGGLPVTSYNMEYRLLHHNDPITRKFRQKIKVLKENEMEYQPYHVDGLECGSSHQFNITSVNPVGESQVFTVMGKTIGEAPVIASVKDLVTNINQTSMLVDLATWHNGGCPITGLTLEYSGPEKTNVNSSNTINKTKIIVPTPRKVRIHDLQPGTWYKLRITSCNIVGCSAVVHSVATLDAAGMTLTSVTLKSRPGGLLLHYMVPMVVGFGLVVLLLLILLRYRYKQQMKKHLRMKEAQKMADSLLGSNAKLRSPSSVKRDRIYDHVSKLDFGQEGEDDVFLPTQATTNLHRSCKSAENLSPNRKRYDKVRHKSDVTRRDELKPFLIEETETVSEKLKKRRLLSYNGDFSASDTWSYRQSSSSNTSNNNTAPLQKKESTSSMSETDEEVAKVFERDNQQNINVKTKDIQTIQEPIRTIENNCHPIKSPLCSQTSIQNNSKYSNESRPVRKSDTEVTSYQPPVEPPRPPVRHLLAPGYTQKSRNYSCESLPSWKGVFLDQLQRHRVNSDNAVLSDQNHAWFEPKRVNSSIRLISTGRRIRPVLPEINSQLKAKGALPAYEEVAKNNPNPEIVLKPVGPMTSHDMATCFRDRNPIMFGLPPTYQTSLPTPPDSSPDEKYPLKPSTLRLLRTFNSVDSINSRLDALCDSPLTPGGSEDRFSTLV